MVDLVNDFERPLNDRGKKDAPVIVSWIVAGHQIGGALAAFGAVDLHPNKVSNSDMGDAFEYVIRKFNEAFAPYGFQEKAIKPSYGLAEATLFVSTTPMEELPKIVHVDRDALNNYRFVEVAADAPSAVAQASAGRVGVDQRAIIVDAESASDDRLE